MEVKNNKLRYILNIAVFSLIIGGFFILTRVITPPEIIQSERRFPAKLPAISMKTISSAEFMDGFESFAADNFPLREHLRTLHSLSVFSLFIQTDKNGLYFNTDGIGEFKRLDTDSIEQVANKIKTIADGLTDVNIYYAFIPDKSVYAARKTPGFDSELAERLLTGSPGMDKFSFIPLTDALDADSFYKTDIHWSQTKIKSVLDRLGAVMNFNVDLSQYSLKYARDFKGGYAGQLALPTENDRLEYFDNPALTASYLNEKTLAPEPAPVYDISLVSGLDPYDFFLRGAQPLVILENSNAVLDRELYLFRDSFSSSLAPLLASAYAKIVLIDLRYLDTYTLNQLVEFKPGSDALFLYSTLILNNASSLLM